MAIHCLIQVVYLALFVCFVMFVCFSIRMCLKAPHYIENDCNRYRYLKAKGEGSEQERRYRGEEQVVASYTSSIVLINSAQSIQLLSSFYGNN